MIITRSPFRITLGGGGTDIPSYYKKYGGSVLSVAIDKYMVVTVNQPIVDKLIRLKYTETEIVEKGNQIKHPLIKEALKLTGISDSIEISSIADIPAGTGMGSSGSFLVSLLKALNTFKGNEISDQTLAEQACEIEIKKLKLPVGKQDQYIASFGGLIKMDIDKTGLVRVTRPNISPQILRDFENSLLIFYTGMRRSSKEVLSNQDGAVKKNQKEVIDMLHQIREIGDQILESLKLGDIVKVGHLFNTHWNIKRQLSSNVSNAQIDEWYQLAISCGALGGKLIGAGGGGFLLFCCPGDKTKLRRAMKKQGLTEMLFHFDTEGTKILVNI